MRPGPSRPRPSHLDPQRKRVVSTGHHGSHHGPVSDVFQDTPQRGVQPWSQKRPRGAAVHLNFNDGERRARTRAARFRDARRPEEHGSGLL